jgi:aspartyl/asparaginyl-tRNA synthetase
MLCQYSKDNFNSDFIFITHYPTSKRPFYTHVDPEDPEFTLSFDLLYRGVEITTGGQRRDNVDSMREGLKLKGLDEDQFSFYLEAFAVGMPQHGGIGMGLERLTQKFLLLDNAKEAGLFPRDINRIDTLLSK